jgi:hypothetical protein
VPLHDVVWVSHAEQQFNSLVAPVRQAVMAKIGLLQQDPTRYGTYDKKVDNYVTDFEYGVIVYAVVADQLKIIMLRVIAPGY